jgi:hypothetical protein
MTGPSRRTRTLVLERDDYRCVCCGQSIIGRWYEIQHRDARGMGGTSRREANLPPNLLTMLREHHLRVERRGEEDNARGYWLRMGEDPLTKPVMVFSEGGSGVMAWPTIDGRYVYEAPAGVAS